MLMIMLFQGEPVIVLARDSAGVDELGMPVAQWSVEQTVDDALVAPGPLEDAEGNLRGEGDLVTYVLHFPKSFTGSLRNKRVRVRGEEFTVVGDPKQYTLANTPGRWNMPVRVQTVEG